MDHPRTQPPGQKQDMTGLGDELIALGYEAIPCYDKPEEPAFHKRPIGNKWQTGITVGQWQKAKGQPFLLGILTRRNPAIDIDVRDEALADELQILAEEVTSSKPPVRVGQAPKRALLFRGGGFQKLTMWWDDADGVEHRIEILVEGAQLIAYGLHPVTKQPYVWNGRGEPATIPQAQLPVLTHDEAVMFLRLARAKLRAIGIEPKTFSGPGLNARETDPEGCSNNDLRSALDAYRNADLDYDSWIKVGLALKDAARSGLVSDAEGRDLWLWWSAQSAKDDPTLSAKKWDSFDPRQIGVRTIFWLARAAGWRGGPAKTKAGAAPAPAEVDAIIEAIVDRWREQFQPAHLKSDGFWSLSKNALVRKGGVNPDAAMFRALLPFAPVENGLPKTNAIPRLYSSWASFAWGELLNRLPDEADYTAHDAHEPFLLTMERMLCSMVSCVVKGSDIPEPKTLASWLAQITIDTMARPGWQQLRTYASWGRRIPPLEPSGATLEAALKPVLATQIPRAPKEIAEMTPKMLTVLAKRHGIGRGETLRISGTEFRATVINADFVAACLAGDIFATMTQEQYIAWRAAKKGAEE